MESLLKIVTMLLLRSMFPNICRSYTYISFFTAILPYTVALRRTLSVILAKIFSAPTYAANKLTFTFMDPSALMFPSTFISP